MVVATPFRSRRHPSVRPSGEIESQPTRITDIARRRSFRASQLRPRSELAIGVCIEHAYFDSTRGHNDAITPPLCGSTSLSSLISLCVPLLLNARRFPSGEKAIALMW